MLTGRGLVLVPVQVQERKRQPEVRSPEQELGPGPGLKRELGRVQAQGLTQRQVPERMPRCEKLWWSWRLWRAL